MSVLCRGEKNRTFYDLKTNFFWQSSEIIDAGISRQKDDLFSTICEEFEKINGLEYCFVKQVTFGGQLTMN